MSSHGTSRRTALLQTLELEDRLTPTQAAFDPEHVLVSFAEVVPEAWRTASLAGSAGVKGFEALGLGLYRVAVSPGVDRDVAERELRGLSGTTSVGPDYIIRTQTVPNDPVWNANRSAGNSIGLPAAWSTTTGTGQTIVAVIDTGIDVTHPDLAPNLWRNPGEIAGNNRDDDGNGFIDDLHGVDFTTNSNNLTDSVQHGTHVAGIIGAVGNNGQGVAGVNWRTRIMPLKFIGANGGLTSDAVRALDYALRNGAKIINASWGGSPYDTAFAAALNRARSAGAIVVASAGNYATDTDRSPFYPAAYTTQFNNVLGVAATDDAGNLASWSNFGATSVTVAAPGVNITSTLNNGRYGALGGTSMAAPFVSGALALLWDQNPTWTYSQILDKLKTSVDRLPGLSGKVATGGRLNVAELVNAGPVNPPALPVAPPPPTADRTGPRVVAAQFSGAKAGQFDRVRLTFSEAVNAATLTNANVAVAGPTSTLSISSVIPTAGTNGTQFTLLFSRAQSTTGSYTMRVHSGVRDISGNPLDQNGNGITGEAGDFFQITSHLAGTASPPPPTVPVAPPPVSPPSGSRVNYTPGLLPRIVLPRRTTRFEIVVNETFAVEDLTVTLNLVHPRPGDLSLRLSAPDGRRATLVNRTGFAATTTFADRNGTKPLQPLSTFQGAPARGTWVLELFDLGDGGAGSLNTVSLGFARTSIAARSLWPAGAPHSLNAEDLDSSSDERNRAILGGRSDAIAKVR